MTAKQEQEITQIGIRLLDDAYTAWFMAEHECEQALRAWFEGPPRDNSAMYLSYRTEASWAAPARFSGRRALPRCPALRVARC